MKAYNLALQIQRFYKIEADSKEEAIEKVKRSFEVEKELNQNNIREVSELVKEKSEKS